MENIIDVINNAAEYIADSIKFTPEIAIILGSGLGPLADEVQSPVVIKHQMSFLVIVACLAITLCDTIKNR